MCGICGEFIWKNQQSSAPQKSLALVNQTSLKLKSRGPDASGLSQLNLNDIRITLGHRRLSIIDLSEKSNQPMHSEGGSSSIQPRISQKNQTVLVFNGCIYNHKLLRKELIKSGAQFKTTSDTEVILQAWHYWGEKCISRLDGMFAFAIWDSKEEALYLVRDRFGIKPLYYTIDKQTNTIRFASTLPALLTDVDTSLNNKALHHLYHLHAIVPSPDTIINGIKKLAPAHWLKINSEEIKQQQYWHLPQKNEQLKSKVKQEEWQEQCRHLLKQAVQKRLLTADVAVGILLSGGLDSSMIVAFADEIKKSGVWDQSIRTYSIGFDDIGEERGNEFDYSDEVVEQFKTEHYRYRIENSEVLKRLPEAIENMSEPMFSQDAIAFYLLSEQVSKTTKVVLSGQGADEVFAGYFWYPQIHQADMESRQSPYQTILPYYLDRNYEEWKTMMQPKWHEMDHTKNWLNNQFKNTNQGDLLIDLLNLDVTKLIVDDPVKRVDNMTMAWSLEARVPFLDTDLVEHANQMPIDLKLKHQGKGVLKDIASQWFSHDFIHRKKDYFPMPSLKYIQGDFLTLMSDTMNSTRAKERGLFQKTYIDKLLNKPEEYFTKLQGSKLWHCVLLELWLQTNKI